jgi:hypothetical protein
MFCEDCGKKGAVIRTNSTGNVYRCLECDAKAEEKYGVKRSIDFSEFCQTRKEFKPYVLKDGHIWALPKDWPGKNADNTVTIHSEAHRKATMDRLGMREVEKGEVIGGHTAFLKGHHARLYSFLGNRKANTCH